MRSQGGKGIVIKYEIPSVYFPTFPAPADGVVIPLDSDFKRVKEVGKKVDYVVMPKWYWDLIIKYVEGTECSINALYKKVED